MLEVISPVAIKQAAGIKNGDKVKVLVELASA
jgi:CTP-dependent riboflavin kinase